MSNESHIESLHEVAKPIFTDFLSRLKERGYAVIITSSYRSFDEQQELYELNPKNAKAGYSRHNFGMALDINCLKNGKVFKKDTDKKEWIKSGINEVAYECGIFWGGQYLTYQDPIHFEIKEPGNGLLRKLQAEQGCEGNKVVFS